MTLRRALTVYLAVGVAAAGWRLHYEPASASAEGLAWWVAAWPIGAALYLTSPMLDRDE